MIEILVIKHGDLKYKSIGRFSSDFYSDLPAVDDMTTSSRIYSHRIHGTGIFAYIWLILW